MCSLTLSGTDWSFTSWIIDLDFTVDKCRLWCQFVLCQKNLMTHNLWGTKSCLPKSGFPVLKVTSWDGPGSQRGPQPLRRPKYLALGQFPSYPVLSKLKLTIIVSWNRLISGNQEQPILDLYNLKQDSWVRNHVDLKFLNLKYLCSYPKTFQLNVFQLTYYPRGIL